MENAVELSRWQFWLLIALSGYAILHLFLLPIMQRLIYYRTQSTEKLLNKTLDFGLPSYAMANRQLWVDRIVNDSEVQAAIQQASKGNLSDTNAAARARKYATEIVPTFNILFYFRVGFWLARKVLRMFYWIEIALANQEQYKQIETNSCVILVSNHRSNFDPLLLIYLTSKTAPISYSAGEWALIAPFRQILHAIGFSIIRRNDTDNLLYKKILQRYVFLATQNCIPQGLFIEGELSRDGRMQPLKLGMLNYVVKAYDKGNCSDIVFVPCALNYDRIPEDRTLIKHQDNGFRDKGPLYSLFSFLKFAATFSSYIIPRKHKPYGYACVNFGKPLSLKQWQVENQTDISQLDKDGRREFIGSLGEDIASSIQQLIPVLPTSLLATVLLDNIPEPMTELELKSQSTMLIKRLENANAYIALPTNDGDNALSQGIYILLRRNIICPTGDGRFCIVEGNRRFLDYYSRTVSHYLKAPNN